MLCVICLCPSNYDDRVLKLHPQYAAILNGLNRILFIAMMVGVLVSALDSRRNLSILVLTVALLIMEKVVAGNI